MILIVIQQQFELCVLAEPDINCGQGPFPMFCYASQPNHCQTTQGLLGHAQQT